ncbi:SusC/RagA family TonB-linked outer membrane protein [Arachidicoccus terrestris]|uniref:SusC/RagA family TonB-linked outer membrane protein n=1 Tax=Arachidicoccus terrestris TaxID=2875539 RepID=UPI001CC52265|nr:TonB-dependent receptor [Arachidicoccus terrestris]UAY56201.1 TonB-dependent receptor [Arachidicoccus terrestris]
MKKLPNIRGTRLMSGRGGPHFFKSSYCRLWIAAMGVAGILYGAAAHGEPFRPDLAGYGASMYQDTGKLTLPVEGRVLSRDRQPLVGASVKVIGTSVGDRTDSQGRFRLAAPAGSQIEVSYVGYVAQTFTVTAQTPTRPLVIVMVDGQDSAVLKDVVVVGYGTQSKKTVTGSIASVKYDQFKDRSNSNVAQSMAGALPGVSITQSQGAPGSGPMIKIRGTSSITAGTNPLFVVDGMPMENFDLNLINPQDIASVDVLKDASSAAIYGSRGANGVIIVTTKLGQKGRSVVNATFEYGLQHVDRTIDVMDAQQFIQYYVDAHNNAWVDAGGNASDPNDKRSPAYRIPEDFINDPGSFGKGTNWQSVMFRTAPTRHGEVSVSGGSEKTNFLFSAGYLDQQAVLDRNYYKRLSLRSNIRHRISEKVLTGLNLSFTGIFDRTQGTAGKSDVVSLGLQSDPIFPVYNENGNLGFRDPNSEWYRFTPYSDLIMWHPYSLTREIKDQQKTFNTLATGFLEYQILDDLKFRTSLNANLMNSRANSYRNKNQKYGYSSNLPAQGYAESAYSLNWLTENTFTYGKGWGPHHLEALAGFTAQHQRDEFMSLTAGNFPNDLVPTLNAGTASSGTSTASEWSMLSLLARATYHYDTKYLLTATLRRDGSSRFGKDTKWGYFPSVSAGWVISDEPFLRGADWINLLKLRASYGVAGNNQIPNYGSIGLLSTSNYVSGDQIASGLAVDNLSNLDLKWEKTRQFNLGLDFNFWQNRVSASVEYYRSITQNLLLNVPIPDITGFNTQLTNVGKVRNSGLELGLQTKNLTGELSWDSHFNLSFNRNKVLQLGPGNTPLIFTDYVVTVKTEVGQPISNFYGYKFNGVYNTQSEIDGSPHVEGTRPGEPIVVDVNGDGKINEGDRTTLGNAQPDFTAGIINSFRYRGLEFSFMFQGRFGGQIVNQLTRYMGIWNGGRNAFKDVANYWKSAASPGDGVHFRPSINPTTMEQNFSDYWVASGTYVRLKNILLAYRLPQQWIKNGPFHAVRLYINAENVYLFSDYRNYDPENTTYTPNVPEEAAGNAVPSGAFVGVDYGSYPLPRTITFGVNLEF